MKRLFMPSEPRITATYVSVPLFCLVNPTNTRYRSTPTPCLEVPAAQVVVS